MPETKRLAISHRSTYRYDRPAKYALQRLRLMPHDCPGQTVFDWSVRLEGATRQVVYDDPFLNRTELVKADEDATEIVIVSEGNVEVEDRAGVAGEHAGFTPLWLFEQATPLTAPGPALRELVRELRAEVEVAPGGLDHLHRLSELIGARVAYEKGRTDSATLAEAALAAGHGVCQDHAHVMIAAARLLGQPARYVSGYLLMQDIAHQEATHAWCEVWTEGLGWVGFDISNEICPDERYVRVATGRDYRDAAPITGLRHGEGTESLDVQVQIQQ